MTTTVRCAVKAEPVGWWVGETEEYMNIGGPYPTREEAIASGRNAQCGCEFYICYASVEDWCAPSADVVMEWWIDEQDDLWFEDGFPGFLGPAERVRAFEDDLQRVLNDWFVRHADMLPASTVFAFSRDGEWIDRPVTPVAPAAD